MKQIDASTLDRKKISFGAIICNIIIAALCIASVLALALGDFWKIHASITLDSKTIQEAMSSGTGGGTATTAFSVSGSTVELTAETTTDEMTKKMMDAFEELPKKDRTITLDINLQGKTMLDSVIKKDDAIVHALISDTTHTIIEQVKPLIKTMTKLISKLAVGSAVVYIQDQLIANGIDANAIDAELKKMGIDTAVINKTLDNAMDTLFSKNPDTEKVKNDIMDMTMDIMSKGGFDSKDAEAVNKQFGEYYDKIITDSVKDGELNVDLMINNIMSMFDSNSKGGVNSNTARASIESTAETVTLNNQMEDMLTTMLESQESTVSWVVRGIGIAVILMIAAFAYVVLKIIFKTCFYKEKTVKIWLPLLIADIFFVILCVVPPIALLIAPSLSPTMGTTLSMLSLSFTSSTIYAFAFGFGMWLVWLFGSRKLRKQGKALKAYNKIAPPQCDSQM